MVSLIDKVSSALDFLANETSIPKNIRRGASDAKAKLFAPNMAIDVRATGAMSILDDLANDPNIPSFAMTVIYQALADLETISQQK